MSHSGNLYYYNPVASGVGHVPLLQGATVNPLDLSLMAPLPTESYVIQHNVTSTGNTFVGYQGPHNIPQGAPRFYPPALSQFSSPTSAQFPVIHDAPAGPFTGALTPVGRVSRGPSRCQWILQDGSICDQTITERAVPKHLADHGIRGMHKDHTAVCWWDGCQHRCIKRQGITRHVREVHLGLKRKSPKHAFPRGGFCHRSP